MFILAFFLLAVVSVPLTGGRLSALGEIRLRGIGILVGALAVQILVIEVLPADTPAVVSEGLHLVSYGVAGVFVVLNRRLPGLWLIALGGLLNLVVIAANGGVMPASPGALAAAGMPLTREAFTNSAMVADPVLLALGDVFAIPRGWPFANVFSVGDVLLCAGGAVSLHGLSGSLLTRGGRAGRRQAEATPSPSSAPAGTGTVQ